jgi:hypothetical protein
MQNIMIPAIASIVTTNNRSFCSLYSSQEDIRNDEDSCSYSSSVFTTHDANRGDKSVPMISCIEYQIQKVRYQIRCGTQVCG